MCRSKRGSFKAALVFLLLILAMGICGKFEEEPKPVQDVESVIRAADAAAEAQLAMHIRPRP